MAELEVEDVLNPPVERVDDSYYRVNRKQSRIRKQNYQSPVAPQPYTDNEEMLDCDEMCDYDVEITDNGRFKTTLHLPPVFFAQIIGARGAQRKKLEDETKTSISIPPRGSRSNTITITGTMERNVVAARRRLETFGYELRSRHPATHFISFPLTSSEIKGNFIKFKEMVFNEGHIDGLDESIFKSVDRLHLTIGTMILLDDDEKNEASGVLEQLKKDVIIPQLKGSPPLIIKVEGLDYMNDDPSKVHVLYAKVRVTNHRNEEILQKISDDIANFFHKKAMIRKEGDHVKLHATLINTRYRKDEDDDNSKPYKFKKRIPFDARPIFAKFSNFDFGEQKLETIHISERSSTDESTGYYKPIHKISCI